MNKLISFWKSASSVPYFVIVFMHIVISVQLVRSFLLKFCEKLIFQNMSVYLVLYLMYFWFCDSLRSFDAQLVMPTPTFYFRVSFLLRFLIDRFFLKNGHSADILKNCD